MDDCRYFCVCDCAQNVYSKNVLEYTFSKKTSIRNLYNAYRLKISQSQSVLSLKRKLSRRVRELCPSGKARKGLAPSDSTEFSERRKPQHSISLFAESEVVAPYEQSTSFSRRPQSFLTLWGSYSFFVCLTHPVSSRVNLYVRSVLGRQRGLLLKDLSWVLLMSSPVLGMSVDSG